MKSSKFERFGAAVAGRPAPLEPSNTIVPKNTNKTIPIRRNKNELSM